MKKITVLCILFSMVLSGCLFYSSFGLADYETRTNDYSNYEYTVFPEPAYPYPVINYSVERSSAFVRLFNEIGVTDFEGLPYQESPTTFSHTDDFGELIIHEAQTTAIEYNALQDNGLEVYLAAGTGALKSGKSVVVGNEDAKGYFVTKGDVDIDIAGSRVAFDIPEGASVIFRADPEGEAVIGEATANGAVGGELYMSRDGDYLVEDIVMFDELAMETIAVAEDAIDLKVSGEIEHGQAVVVHVESGMLAYNNVEDIGIIVDGKYVERGAGLSETLYEEGLEAKYYVSRTPAGYDVAVYLPHFSDHIITIGSVQEEIGIDGFATFLSAVAIVGIAAAALVYNRE